jgi:glyoxylase-like metal-dependent hydrolase (beta-lactamase superfamily II)
MSLPSKTLWRLPPTVANVYLHVDDAVTLVDAGAPWDGSRVVDALDGLGYRPGDVDRVLLTHYDFDHVGGLPTLATNGLDATVHVAAPDADYFTGAARPPWSNRKGLFQRLSSAFLRVPDLPVERVEDGDAVGPFTAFRTPGHTPGHTAYVHPAHRVAFLGDMVRTANGGLEPSPPALTYDTARNRQSIREFVARTPAFDVAAAGHGDPIVGRGREALRVLESTL